MKAEAIHTKNNDYEHLTNWRHDLGSWPFALRIWCSGCLASDVVQLPNKLRFTCQQSMADAEFRKKGWLIGRSRKRDACPQCQAQVKRERQERRGVAIQSSPSNVIIIKSAASIQPKEPLMPEPIALRAEPPADMTREDRRLILAKLHDVYLDEHSGYSDEWTDRRLAVDLGVPAAWVALLRDENFGPEKSNETTRKVVAEAQAILVEAKGQRDALNKIAADAMSARDALTPKIDGLTKRLEALEKAYR